MAPPMPTQDELLMVAAGALLVLGLVALVLFARGDRSRGRRRCPKCWYDLSATGGMQCPECGKVQKREARFFRARRRKRVAALGVVLIAGAYASYMTPKVRRFGVYRYLPTWGLICLAPARVPESPFYVVPPPKRLANGTRDSVAYNALLQLSYRSVAEELTPFERWLWITKDRQFGAAEDRARVILDLEMFWSSHAIDLRRERFETEYIEIFPYLQVAGGYRRVGRDGGSIFRSPSDSEDTGTSYSVTQLRDEGTGFTSQVFVEELQEQLVHGIWAFSWWAYEDEYRDDERARTLAQTLAVQGYPFPIEVTQFGMHVVFEADAEHAEAMRLLIDRMSNPLPFDAAGTPLRGAELKWYENQPSPASVRALVSEHEQRGWSSWSYSYPRVERFYDATLLIAQIHERIGPESQDLWANPLKSDAFVSYVTVNGLEGADGYGVDFLSLASVNMLGTTLRLTAPLELHPLLLDVIKQWVERWSGMSPLEEPVSWVYEDGQLLPETPNK